MDLEKLVASLTPQLYSNLKAAVETGKWPDGNTVTTTQREDSMTLVLAYEQKHFNADQRTGFIDKGHKANDVCDDEPQPLKLQ